nr:hypothetical protein [Tanacetum cinerariifolium]
MVGVEEDEVQEVCPSRPIGKDQAKRKGKAKTSSTSLATDFDVELLAKLMVNEYACVSDLHNVKRVIFDKEKPGSSYDFHMDDSWMKILPVYLVSSLILRKPREY